MLSLIQSKNFYLGSVLALLYFSLGVASIYLLHGSKIITIGVFASEGVALAFALLFGKEVVWGIFVGQLILALYNGISFTSSIFIAFINSFEALLAIYLVNKHNIDLSLRSLRDIAYFVYMVAFVLQVFSAISANVVLVFQYEIPYGMFFETTFSWWFGNVMGQLLFTPFILSIYFYKKEINLKEFFLIGIGYAIFIYFITIHLAIESLLLLEIMTIPSVIWAVYYKNIAYGLLFSVIIALYSAYAVHIGVGVFIIGDDISNAINYNLFVLIHIVTVFSANIMFEKHKTFEMILQKRVAEEIEKNKKSQMLLLHQSRLAQMGEMISMIAHQWRQPLNNLSLANQLLITKFKRGKLDNESIDNFAKNSQKQIQLMSQTIDDFRNFFKKESKKELFLVSEAILHTISLVEESFKNKGIAFEVDLVKEYWVEGSKSELSQAILNIINNAKDALLNKDVREKKIFIRSYVENSTFIKIEICDTALGVDEDVIEKIFDPYFTTKESKNGTGLGLYMTKMIIMEKYNGTIDVKNKEKGACFMIQLQGVNKNA